MSGRLGRPRPPCNAPEPHGTYASATARSSSKFFNLNRSPLEWTPQSTPCGCIPLTEAGYERRGLWPLLLWKAQDQGAARTPSRTPPHHGRGALPPFSTGGGRTNRGLTFSCYRLTSPRAQRTLCNIFLRSGTLTHLVLAWTFITYTWKELPTGFFFEKMSKSQNRPFPPRKLVFFRLRAATPPL